jgi:hypothetical protein
VAACLREVDGSEIDDSLQIQSGYFSKKQMNDDILKETKGRGWGEWQSSRRGDEASSWRPRGQALVPVSLTEQS